MLKLPSSLCVPPSATSAPSQLQPIPTQTGTEPDRDAAARKVTQFLRKNMAASVYHDMLTRGEAFSGIGHPHEGGLNKPDSLLAIKNLSKQNLDNILDDVLPLNRAEKNFLISVTNSPWHFRHQTNGPVIKDNGTLNILSNKQLRHQDIKTAEGTEPEDRSILANDDFIFFGVEFTNRSKKRKLDSVTHGNCFYGSDAFILPENDSRVRFGYLTLTDHLCFNLKANSHFDFESSNWPLKHKEMIDGIKDEIESQDLTELETDASIMFAPKDMKLGVALHAIKFLRESESDEFRSWVFNKAKENSKNLHRTLNLIFQPEFHLPRIWSDHKYLHIPLGRASADSLLESRNFKKLDQRPLGIDECAKNLLRAIKHSDDDIVKYLLNRPELIAIEHSPQAMGLAEEGENSITGALNASASQSDALLLLLHQKGLVSF